MSTLPAPVRGALMGAAAGALVLGLLVVSLTTGFFGGGDGDDAAQPGIGTADTATEGDRPGRVRAARRPTSITVPALDLQAEVLPIEVSPDGVLDPPGNVSQVGWWQRSAKIGASQGQTVLTGHSVHSGGGVMDDLEKLSRGDSVEVFHKGKVMTYEVSKVKTWSKAKLADRAENIFAQDRRRARLVLITCEDWNGSQWESNVVVTAKPTGKATGKSAEKSAKTQA